MRATTRTPLSGASRKGQSRDWTGTDGLGLTGATNQTLVGINDSGKVGPKTQDAINAALSGKLLTSQQAGYLTGAIEKNPNLTPVQKAAIASALQADSKAKFQLALAKASGGGGTSGGSGKGGKHGGTHKGGAAGGDGGSTGGDGGSTGGDGGSTVAGAASGAVESEALPVVEAAGQTAKSAIGGMKIVGLSDGTAAQQGLRKGDVILSFNGVATTTFEALRDAVQQSGAKAEVVFLNVDNGLRESIVLYPKDGRLGAEIEEVQVEA